MLITIPSRQNLPKTELFVKVIKKDHTQNFFWTRDTMILIHGGSGGNHALYSDIENDLLDIADLVLIDLRGCGLSAKIDAQYCTLDAHIDDLQVVLQTLKLPNPIIHGCSYGAIVTLGFSIKYPHLPKKIILSSCAVDSSCIEMAKEHLQKRGSVEQIKAAERLWNGRFENQEQLVNYYKIMAPLYIYKNTSSGAPATPQDIPYNLDLVNLTFTSILKTLDFRDQLSQVQASTLILCGKNDWIVDPKQSEIIHDGIAHSILRTLDECGHFPWKDQRKIFLSTIKDFVSNHLD